MAATLPKQDVAPGPSRDSTDRELQHRRFLETVERIRADNLTRDEMYLERDFWRRRGLD